MGVGLRKMQDYASAPPGDPEEVDPTTAHSTRLWSVGSIEPLVVDASFIEDTESLLVKSPSMRLWTVVCSVLATCLLTILVGATLAFSSPAVLQLKELEDPELRFNVQLSDIFGVSTTCSTYTYEKAAGL